jgi:hypothetical protein
MTVYRTITRGLLCLALLALTSGTLFAESDSGSVVQGKVPWVMASKGQGGVRTPAHFPKKLKTIYSNLGSSTDAYYSGDGWLILGKDAAYGEEVWIGFPFTPTASATATEVETGLNYYSSGTNSFSVSLNADAAGLPGKVLFKGSVKNVPTWPACCQLAPIKSKKGKKLKSATQYWVVVYTSDTTQTTSEGVWDWTYNEVTGTQAYNINETGWLTETTDISAFAVLGK